MRRVPVLVLIAALVIATTATILIHVLPISQLAAPPLVNPSTTFTVAEGTYAVFYYSATSVSVSSNVTADFGLLSTSYTPVVALSAPLPPNIMIRITYTDPVAKYTVDVFLYNDTATGKTYYKYVYWPSPNAFPWYVGDFPAVVVRQANKIVLYPDVWSMGWIVKADDNGITFYDQNGYVVASAGYMVKYHSTTGYSQSFENTPYTYILPDGSTIAIAVRPFIIAAVKPTADAQVTISAS